MIPVSRMLHFPRGTRLMCPSCGTLSNNHKPHSPREEYYWDKRIPPGWVCLHTCHRCGYTDDTGDGFTDAGNDDRDEFRNVGEWEEELYKLKKEVQELEYKINHSKELWELCWESDKDYS